MQLAAHQSAYLPEQNCLFALSFDLGNRLVGNNWSILRSVSETENYEMDNREQTNDAKSERHEGNTCIALGAGVGALGAASAALTGAICPLCIFIAPGLIGYGAFRRWKGSQNEQRGDKNEKQQF